jgi:tetratricopeptide (TPR) repeat protein
MNRIIFLLCLLLVSGASSAQDDYYYSRDNLIKFAENLFSTGDYERAIGEYLRAAAHCEEDSMRDSLWYRIAVAYLYLSRPLDARRYADRILHARGDTLGYDRTVCLRAFSYYLEHRYDSAALLQPVLLDDQVWRQRLYQIRIASLLRQYRWQEAVELSAPSMADSLSIGLQTIARQGISLEFKSPITAGFLSAIVPGSGKLYARRGWDGLYSLLIVGTMAWQSYEGYRKDGPVSVRCLLFGGLGGVFYTGNIYGSIAAARKNNESKRSALAERVTLRFTW